MKEKDIVYIAHYVHNENEHEGIVGVFLSLDSAKAACQRYTKKVRENVDFILVWKNNSASMYHNWTDAYFWIDTVEMQN